MTEKPKRSSTRSKLIKLAALSLVACSLIAGWQILEYREFTGRPLLITDPGVDLTVQPGMSLHKISEQLVARGVIEYARFLNVLGRQTGLASRIHAGEYLVEPGTTPRQLLDQLASGKVIQHSLTIVEGWTFRQVRDAMATHPVLKKTIDGLSDSAVMEKIGHADEHPEGRFLPDTYFFPRGTTDIEFLKRAYSAMSDVLASEWENRAPGLPLQTPYEALILASIVERETGKPDERAMIAGVFVQRLERKMRLQTDPTVIYGLGPSFDGDIRSRDLKTDTPYNTYTRAGLPPTPIAMPGEAALHAVLHPAKTDALYFVARGDGSHEFSSSLKAHNRAVRKYQLGKSP